MDSLDFRICLELQVVSETLEPPALARQILQRLESLRRAGLDRIPRPPECLASPSPVPVRSVEVEPRPVSELATTPPAPAPALRPSRRPEPPRRPAISTSLFEESGLDPTTIVPIEERPGRLAVIEEEVAACARCPELVQSRTRTVFGEGSPQARLMFIGEGPGAEEDRTGRPFVGKAGQLLNDMITKGMGLNREDVYIANMVKCRPPGNRDPHPEEVANCRGYLDRQIAIIRPEFLCLLGRVAAQGVLQTALPLGRLRGRWHSYQGIPTLATYHPAYLLRYPTNKREAWEDLKMLMTAMKIRPPSRK